MKNKKTLLIISGTITACGIGYGVYNFVRTKKKKAQIASIPVVATQIKENNNWDDNGGYRIVTVEGVALYYDKNNVYKGRSDQKGNWVPA